jgi:hypothetical protein
MTTGKSVLGVILFGGLLFTAQAARGIRRGSIARWFSKEQRAIRRRARDRDRRVRAKRRRGQDRR